MRFTRGDETFDLWVDGTQRLLSREGTGPTVVRRTPPNSWVMAGLREESIARLAAGWRRVRDPEREVEVHDEPREPRFEAALAEDPDDTAAALVYADWYQQQDHPRGDLIAVQCALAKRDDAALREREAWLLRERGDQLVGPVRDHPNVELSWRHGFVDGVRLVGALKRAEDAYVLWELLRHPAGRFLRAVELACYWYVEIDVTTELLLASEVPLRTLHALDDGFDPTAARLVERFPRLEDLVLAGPGLFSEPVAELPRVRRFAYRSSHCDPEHLVGIAAARWPALEELEIQFGEPAGYEEPESCSADDVEALLAFDAPKLRALRLSATFADDLVARLVRSPRAASLEVLDLSNSELTDAGALVLAARRSAFASLTALHVVGCQLTPEGIGRLVEAGFPIRER